MADAIEGTISRLDTKGRGILETAKGLVAVPFTVPGDCVRVEIIGKRRGVRIARVVETMSQSSDRVVPRCPYVGACGGCPWQMIDYPAQLRHKRELVQRALRHISLRSGSKGRTAVHGFEPFVVPALEDIPAPEVIPATDIFSYRNRMDYVIGAKGELGLKASEQWWNVLDLSTCFLLSPDAVEVMSQFRAWMRERHVQPWNNQTHQGFARYLVIREGKRTNERMVMVITAPGELPGREDLITRIQPLATSILWGINPRITDLSIADTVHVLYGNEKLHEELYVKTVPGTLDEKVPGTLFTFEIPPNAFFQTNTTMAERLVETVREFATLTGTELLVDLYCGVGVFGIALARDAARVIGVESEPSAIPVAQRNAIANNVTNAQFVLAKSESWQFPIDPIDVLIVDPPRAGLHPRVIQKILTLQPQRIVYVSCNPTALARDLKPLLTRYTCNAIRCLDLFPHTPHVETVVRLERKSV